MDPVTELLTRGVANIIPGKAELEKVLRSNRKLNIYCGFDVTAPQLHLGNGVPLRKLQQFVNLGHHVTFLIGDFTTLVGDTSDKDTERPVIPENLIDQYWQTYSAQAGKLIDLSKVTVRRNSEWLDKLSSREIVTLIRRFSLNDFISRELIKKRLSSGSSVNLSEAVYPALQGYDSLYLDTDIQVGATDQTFNMQAGRSLIKQIKNKDSFVMAFEFLSGTDGRKMSKSWGNAIWLADEPNDMYGKVMSLKDDLIDQYFTLATNLSLSQISNLKSQISNPMDLKKTLAHQIVSELHNPADADSAQKHFETTVQKKDFTADAIIADEFSLSGLSDLSVLSVLNASGLTKSKSEARRLIGQKGVKLNGQTISNYSELITHNSLLSIGSHRHLKII